MVRLSAHIGFLFNEVPFLERFAAAAAAGFKAVEFVSPYEFDKYALADLLAEHNLEIAQFASPPGLQRGMAAILGGERQFRDSLALTVDYARTLGCCKVHVMSGVRMEKGAELEVKTYLRNIDYGVRFLADQGIQTLIEVINPTEVSGYLMESYDLAEVLFESTNNDDLKLLLDTYHTHTLGQGIHEVLEGWWGHIGHVQVSDSPGRHQPGTGSLDFKGFFSALDLGGYQGWVGCEYRPLGSTLQSLSDMRAFL